MRLGSVSLFLIGVSALTAAAETARWDVGIRDVYLGGMNQPTVWEAAKTIGVRRLEVVVDKQLGCPGLFEGSVKPHRIDTPEDRETLTKVLADHNMSISCFCADVRGGAEGPDKEAVPWLTRVAEVACGMKVPIIMVPLCYGAKSDEQFIQQSVELLRALAPVAKRTGVTFAIENLGKYLNRREILMPILKTVGNDQIGLAHDVCNMYWFGHPVDMLYDLAKDVAPYVRYVHVKNIKYPPEKKNVQRTPGWEYGKHAEPVRTGDIDFQRILGIYANAGFKGDLTIEDDSLGKFDAVGKKNALIDDVKLLREIIERLSK